MEIHKIQCRGVDFEWVIEKGVKGLIIDTDFE